MRKDGLDKKNSTFKMLLIREHCKSFQNAGMCLFIFKMEVMTLNVLLLLPTLNTYPVIRTRAPLRRYYMKSTITFLIVKKNKDFDRNHILPLSWIFWLCLFSPLETANVKFWYDGNQLNWVIKNWNASIFTNCTIFCICGYATLSLVECGTFKYHMTQNDKSHCL